MPDTQFIPATAATVRANALKTRLVASKLRLIGDGYIPTVNDSVETLEEHEIAFDGYPAGGYALAAWTGPINAQGGGAVITSPIATVTYGPAEDPPVTGIASGWWIETAAGVLELAGTFNPTRPLQADGQGFPFFAQDVEGKNAPASL